MRTFYVIFVLVLLCGVPIAACADIYAWTDENGIKHFSNHSPPDGADLVIKTEELPYDGISDEERKKEEMAQSLAAAWQEIAEIESEAVERQQKAEREIEEANQKAEQAIQEAEALLSEARKKYSRSYLYFGYYPYHPYYPYRHYKEWQRHKKHGIHYKFLRSRHHQRRDRKHRHHSAHAGDIGKKHLAKEHPARHDFKKRGHFKHRLRFKTHRHRDGHPFKGRSVLSLRLK